MAWSGPFLAARPEPDRVCALEPASATPGRWVDARDLRTGDLLLQRSGDVVKIKEVRPYVQRLEVYNLRVAELQSHAVGFSQVLTHNYPPDDVGAGAGDAVPADLGAGAGMERQPATLDGPVSFGKNFVIKVRKHINQVRNRGSVPEDIPSPGRGGAERVAQIIQDRVAQGGGRDTTYAGEPAVAFEDQGVTYIFRPHGEFWTIPGN